MTSLQQIAEVVIGAGTHVHTHSAAVVDARTGGVLAEITVTADADGYQELIDFAGKHTITLSRLRYDPTTQAYAKRRTAEGKTPRDTKRCLKRYIARDLYRLLEHPAAT